MIQSAVRRAMFGFVLWSAVGVVGCSSGGSTAGEQPVTANAVAAVADTQAVDTRPSSASETPTVTDSGAVADHDSLLEADPAPLPTGIEPSIVEIPAIGVDAPVIGLDLTGEEPEVPTDFDQVGWYRQTRRPGEIGPAVLAGHIDSFRGPAVFARLDELQVGDRVLIHGPDGETRTFAMVASGQYAKTELPREVFGFGRAQPELRLITCGGSFDRSTGHYRDNYVVYLDSVAGTESTTP